MTFVETKIEEAYKVALMLGLDKAADIQKDLFRKALNQIAVTAIDEVRNELTDIMHNKSQQYTKL